MAWGQVGVDHVSHTNKYCRADSRFEPSQWETSLQSNAVSHWLGANLESALCNLAGFYTPADSWMLLFAKGTTINTHVNVNLIPRMRRLWWLSLRSSHSGIISCMRHASERRRYKVTSSLIGWAHTQNDPCSLGWTFFTRYSNVVWNSFCFYYIT